MLNRVALPARHGVKAVFRHDECKRARQPNHGYLKIAELPDKAPDWMHGHSRLRYREGDFRPFDQQTFKDILEQQIGGPRRRVPSEADRGGA